LVLVDDGSEDESYSVMEELQRDSAYRLRIVKLTRNFGSMAAIQAGLAATRESSVAIIGADLQDPPELLEKMHAEWRAGAKCVYAVRANREEGIFKKLFAHIFHVLLRRFALRGYPPGGFDFCLIDRQVVDKLLRIGEKNTHVMNLIFWLGYTAVWLPYTRSKRAIGNSRWTLQKRLKLFADSFVAFSFAPIRAVTVIA
jgi:dolichol-phosphate mannosyltransferase